MRIAITGGPGDGKSTVLQVLSDLGECTTSSDVLAKVVFSRQDVQEHLSSLLGAPMPVLAVSVRAALADPVMRREINRITHPLILRELSLTTARFIEVPLLVETCLQGRFDQVWGVDSGPEERLRRLTARYGSESAARQLLATQLPVRVKLAFADQIFRTNQPFEDVRRMIIAAVREL